MKTKNQYLQYVLNNYGRPNITFVRGLGTHLWDDTGKQYLDFTTGIAVNVLGHSHPQWTEKIKNQLDTLTHCSNLYRNTVQGELAERLVDKIGPGQLFFCNSGTEAVESLIKLARLHGTRKTETEGQCCEIITASNAFHGRTLGSVSASPQEKIRHDLKPLLPGFTYAMFNKAQSFAGKLSENTAAILIETIQGEGGICQGTPEFLTALESLCHANNSLLMLDEVQCGIARTGKFLAYQHTAIQPDAIALAKGLGGGFPIGAVWVREPFTDLFYPGSHGSTYGGNPLACTAALAVLDAIDEENLLDRAQTLGNYLHQQLEQLQESHPQHILALQGQGLMRGLTLSFPPADLVTTTQHNGLLTVGAGNNCLRLLPPLTVNKQEINQAMDILTTSLASITITP